MRERRGRAGEHILRRLRMDLLLAHVAILTLYAGAAYAAVTHIPPLVRSEPNTSVLVPVHVPVGWPLDEVQPPANAWRTMLPKEFRGSSGEYTANGIRWSDPLNYGKYPILWMVSFKSPDVPEVVYNDLLDRLQMPLYRLESCERQPLTTRFFWQYCDGSTMIYLDGPGPFAVDPVYTLRILIYDH